MAAKRKLAGRDKLLNAVERRYAEYEVDGYGWIRVQSLNAAEATSINLASTTDGKLDPEKHATYKQRLIIACLVDESGHKQYVPEDLDALSLVDATLIDAIYERCEQHLNGEMVTAKNLSETNGDGSGSDSLQLAAG